MSHRFAAKAAVTLTALALSLGLAPAAQAFTDVDSDNAHYTGISWLESRGFSKGYVDGTFRTSRTITRGEVLSMMWRMAGSPGTSASSWALKRGLITGYANGDLGLDRESTRGEFITILHRLAGKPAPSKKSPVFHDLIGSTSYYAIAAKWAAGEGITQGYADYTFKPERKLTRGETATMLYRYVHEEPNSVVEIPEYVERTLNSDDVPTPNRSFDFDAAKLLPVKGTPRYNLYDNGLAASMYRQNERYPSKAVVPQLSTKHARSGDTSMRAHVAPYSGYARSEMGVAKFPVASGAQAMAYSVYIPKSYMGPSKAGDWAMMSQLWQTSCGSPVMSLSFTSNTDADRVGVRMNVRNDQTAMRSRAATENIWNGQIPKGKWVRVVQEFDPGLGKGSGYVKLFIDGKLVAHNPDIEVGNTTSQCAGEESLPNSNWLLGKIGVYHGGNAGRYGMTLYFDDVKTGRPGIR